MKRRFALLILALLLTTACAAPRGASAGTATGAETAIAAVAAAMDGISAPAAAALTDPTDDDRRTAEAFSLTSEAGEIAPEGSVYTVTAAGEYTLSGALADGQIVVDAGDEAKVKLVLKNAAVTCSFGAPIYVKSAAEATVRAETGTYNTVSDLRTGSAEGVEDDGAVYAACDLKLSGDGTLIVETAFDNGVKSKDDLTLKDLTLKVTAAGNALKGNDSVTIKSGSLLLISTASDGVKTENSDLSSKGKQRGTISIQGGQVDVYAARDGLSAAYDVEIAEEEACAVNIYTAAYADEGAATGGTATYLVVPAALYSEDLSYYACLYTDDGAATYQACTYETMIYGGRTAYYGLSFRIPDGYTNVRFEIVQSGVTPDGTNQQSSTAGETVNGAMNGYLITAVSNDTISGDWVQISDGGSSAKTAYSAKGVKAENEIRISGGTITIYAMDDGLHANGGASLESGGTGLGSITVNGGTLTVTAADDGLHADGALTVNSGTVTVVESHEGLEANVVTLNGGAVDVYADDDGLNAGKGSLTPMVYIHGGTARIRTGSGDTDAIDSNGSFEMTGGTVLVLGGSQMGGMSGSVDVDGTVTVTGGTIVALGGICQLPQSGSVNTYVSSGTSFPAGTYRLTDGSGNAILTFTLSEGYASCWIASEAFALNGSYAVEKDGSTLLSWTQSSSTAGDAGSFGAFGSFGGFGGYGGRGRH